jgi:hypothetical protein
MSPNTARARRMSPSPRRAKRRRDRGDERDRDHRPTNERVRRHASRPKDAEASRVELHGDKNEDESVGDEVRSQAQRLD